MRSLAQEVKASHIWWFRFYFAYEGSRVALGQLHASGPTEAPPPGTLSVAEQAWRLVGFVWLWCPCSLQCPALNTVAFWHWNYGFRSLFTNPLSFQKVLLQLRRKLEHSEAKNTKLFDAGQVRSQASVLLVQRESGQWYHMQNKVYKIPCLLLLCGSHPYPLSSKRGKAEKHCGKSLGEEYCPTSWHSEHSESKVGHSCSRLCLVAKLKRGTDNFLIMNSEWLSSQILNDVKYLMMLNMMLNILICM